MTRGSSVKKYKRNVQGEESKRRIEKTEIGNSIRHMESQNSMVMRI